MKTLTAEQFKKQYGEVGLSSLQNTIQSQKQTLRDQGKAVSVRDDRAEPTLGGSVLRGIASVPIKAGLSIPAAVRGEKGMTVDAGNYLGKVSDIAKTIRDNADDLAERVNKGEITLPGALLRSVGNSALETADLASLVPGGVGIKASTTVAGKTGQAVARVAESITDSAKSTIAPVTESVLSTIGSAVRRGGEAIKESVQQAQKVSVLPEVEKIAVRSGLDSGVIDFVKTSSANVIPTYKKIIAAAKSGAGNLRGGNAAKEVVGKEIVNNVVKPVIQVRTAIGKKIGEIVKSLPTVKESITDSVDEFVQVLNSVGVKVGPKGKLISGRGGVTGDLSAYQNMFNRIKQGTASQRQISEIRSAIFKEFDLAKTRLQPFSEQADMVAERFRSILGKKIQNKDYIKYSKAYSDVMKALGDFVKYTSYKGPLEKIGTQNLRVAEVAQRVLGNASARPQEIIDNMVSIAEKLGKKTGLSKEISDSIRFSDLIEDFYGLQQTRSLGGQTARAVKAGIEGATEGAIEGASQGGITGLFGKIVKGVLGKTTAEQQRALDLLLESLSKK